MDETPPFQKCIQHCCCSLYSPWVPEGAGGVITPPPPSFWQISKPYSNGGGQIMCVHHITTAPPRFLDLPLPLLSVAKSHFHVERVNAGVSFETFPYLVVNDFAILKLC